LPLRTSVESIALKRIAAKVLDLFLMTSCKMLLSSVRSATSL
jgi:hypothetical protein